MWERPGGNGDEATENDTAPPQSTSKWGGELAIWARRDSGRRRASPRSGRSSTRDLLLRRRHERIPDPDEMPEFPRKTRPSAGKRFFDSAPFSGMNGHQTDT